MNRILSTPKRSILNLGKRQRRKAISKKIRDTFTVETNNFTAFQAYGGHHFPSQGLNAAHPLEISLKSRTVHSVTVLFNFDWH
jgi:hypothetical protein